ncbi:MAG: hypothetical protein DME26_08580, partial [Verrucomicrobia bacterium]
MMFVGLGVLLAGLGFFVLLPREPTYQGRSLSEWLKEFDGVEMDRYLPPISPSPTNVFAEMSKSKELKVKYRLALMPTTTNAVAKTTEMAEMSRYGRALGRLPPQPDPNPFHLYRFQFQDTSTASVVKAVRAMGANAMPALERMIAAKDSSFQPRLTRFSQKYLPFEFYFPEAHTIHDRARK